MDEAAKREIIAALRETSGAVKETARLLGVSRVALWARMKAYAIEPDTFRST